MLNMADMETQRIIYIIVIFSFAYLLAFILYKGMSKNKPKSPKN